MVVVALRVCGWSAFDRTAEPAQSTAEAPDRRGLMGAKWPITG